MQKLLLEMVINRTGSLKRLWAWNVTVARLQRSSCKCHKTFTCYTWPMTSKLGCLLEPTDTIIQGSIEHLCNLQKTDVLCLKQDWPMHGLLYAHQRCTSVVLWWIFIHWSVLESSKQQHNWKFLSWTSGRVQGPHACLQWQSYKTQKYMTGQGINCAVVLEISLTVLCFVCYSISLPSCRCNRLTSTARSIFLLEPLNKFKLQVEFC